MVTIVSRDISKKAESLWDKGLDLLVVGDGLLCDLKTCSGTLFQGYRRGLGSSVL